MPIILTTLGLLLAVIVGSFLSRLLPLKVPLPLIQFMLGAVLSAIGFHVALNPEICRGTVSMPKGLWRRSTYNGSTTNALCPDTLTDIGDGACFNDARVEVALLGRH